MSSIASFIVDEFNSVSNKKDNIFVTMSLKDHNSTQLDLAINEMSLLDEETIYIRGVGGDEKQPYRMIIRSDIISQFVMYNL